jgi:hypothetical protein
MGRALCAFAIVAVVGARAHAEPAEVRLVGEGVPAWQAEAVARAVTAELDDPRFHKVVVTGKLASDRLEWAIAVGGAVLKHGETELHGTTVTQVAGALKSEIGRLLGGDDSTREVAELPARVGDAEPAALAALAGVALFLLVPFVVGRRVKGERLRDGRAFRRTIAVVVGLALVAAVLVLAGDYEWSWAIFAGGGLAWGGFAAVLLPVMFPALPGLDRVEHTELVGALARWVVLALQRVLIVALGYAPFMAALVLACWLLDVPRGVELAVLVPAWGLCVRLWWQAWVERAAARLDAQLVDGDPTAANPWHDAVRGYVLGYLRRAGLGTDDRAVEGIRFLPGTRHDVETYGGGTTHTRVVIPRPMLELALAPYGRPHDYAAPRVSTLHWTLWNAGLVVPSEVGAVMPTREQRQPRTLAVEGDADQTVLGEPPTFAGIVEPSTLDERPAYRPHEDTLWLDFDAGDEHDGTDAGDKDFLFGILVHELGRVRRHEDRFATLRLALHCRIADRPRLARPIVRVERLLARQVHAVDDVHVRLNLARDHFAQYLAWKIWRREDLLTARAFAPELRRQSRVLARMAGGTVDTAGEKLPRSTSQAEQEAALEAWGKDAGGAPDLRARIVRLAEAATTTTPRLRRWRRLALAAVGAAALAGAALAVVRAIDYHATYEARIKAATPVAPTAPATPTTENDDGQGS